MAFCPNPLQYGRNFYLPHESCLEYDVTKGEEILFLRTDGYSAMHRSPWVMYYGFVPSIAHAPDYVEHELVDDTSHIM